MSALPPDAEPDLLRHGSRREPVQGWRPTRRQRVHAGLAVAVVALGTGGVLVGRSWRHERALDAASRSDVRLAVAWQGSGQAGLTSLILTSLGSRPVTVQRVALAGFAYPGYLPTLRQGGSTDLPFSLLGDCAHRPPTPTSLGVELTTSRRLEVRRSVPLPAEARRALADNAAQTCADPPQRALTWYVVGQRVQGDTALVTYGLENLARVPLTITRLTPLSGLEVAGVGLPLTLPPRDPGGSTVVTYVTARVRVADCAQLRARLRHPFADELVAVVEAQGRTGSAGLTLTDYQSSDSQAEQPSTLAALRRACR